MSSCHYLQDFAVQQVSSCWTVCPAGVQQYNIYRTWLSSKCPAAGQCVQQVSSSTIFTGFACPANVQLLDSVSSNPIFTKLGFPADVQLMCPAVQYLPKPAVFVHWHVFLQGCMPTGLKCVEDLQTYMHGMNDIWRWCVLHVARRSSVARFVLNWCVAAWRS